MVLTRNIAMERKMKQRRQEDKTHKYRRRRILSFQGGEARILDVIGGSDSQEDLTDNGRSKIKEDGRSDRGERKVIKCTEVPCNSMCIYWKTCRTVLNRICDAIFRKWTARRRFS